ncbi:hypothetical protein VTP01DRAFT_4772 [Rhizomucor pusillus]|uniref:uncharacterized protein n=1 Tax=Rhizomucor pusillus TaxID=4840 RepID=UPI003742AC2E
MTTSLDGKVAVVTGGSRGIGKAVAIALVERGAKVVIGDILEKQGQETVEELNKLAGGEKAAAFIRTDVVKYKDNIALFKFAESEFGGVDIAFLNAGIGSKSNTIFLPLDDDLDERMIDINATAVIKGTKVATLHMAKRGGGVIVNTASVAGLMSAPPLSSYNASKHAVVGWTRSFELLPAVCGVRVNAICPYWCETDIIKDLSNTEGADPWEAFVGASPRVSIDTIVEGVLTLIEDETRNAQTLLALPGGVIRPQEPIQAYPETVTEQLLASREAFIRDEIAFYKKQLQEALQRYGI